MPPMALLGAGDPGRSQVDNQSKAKSRSQVPGLPGLLKKRGPASERSQGRRLEKGLALGQPGMSQ